MQRERTLNRPCRKCGQWLPITEFSTNGKGRPRSVCRKCDSAAASERRARRAGKDPELERKRTNARRRAKNRLVRLAPELFARVYAEELKKEGLEVSGRMLTWIEKEP